MNCYLYFQFIVLGAAFRAATACWIEGEPPHLNIDCGSHKINLSFQEDLSFLGQKSTNCMHSNNDCMDPISSHAMHVQDLNEKCQMMSSCRVIMIQRLLYCGATDYEQVSYTCVSDNSGLSLHL